MSIGTIVGRLCLTNEFCGRARVWNLAKADCTFKKLQEPSPVST
jgi:hypothetical protein